VLVGRVLFITEIKTYIGDFVDNPTRAAQRRIEMIVTKNVITIWEETRCLPFI